MSTNFEKVAEFNTSFGSQRLEPSAQPTLFTDHSPLVQQRMDLIREEMRELEEAVTTHNMVETIDALADILYVVYGMGDAIGVDLNRAFQLVHDSNMSKICKTEQEAQETVHWYTNGNNVYDSPSYRKSPCGKYWVVFNKSTGKILKSILYTPVDLSAMVVPTPK